MSRLLGSSGGGLSVVALVGSGGGAETEALGEVVGREGLASSKANKFFVSSRKKLPCSFLLMNRSCFCVRY